jgi:hypothetical protein
MMPPEIPKEVARVPGFGALPPLAASISGAYAPDLVPTPARICRENSGTVIVSPS